MNTNEAKALNGEELEALNREILHCKAILKALSEAIEGGGNDCIALTDIAREKLHNIDCIACRLRGEKEPEAPADL